MGGGGHLNLHRTRLPMDPYFRETSAALAAAISWRNPCFMQQRSVMDQLKSTTSRRGTDWRITSHLRTTTANGSVPFINMTLSLTLSHLRTNASETRDPEVEGTVRTRGSPNGGKRVGLASPQLLPEIRYQLLWMHRQFIIISEAQ